MGCLSEEISATVFRVIVSVGSWFVGARVADRPFLNISASFHRPIQKVRRIAHCVSDAARNARLAVNSVPLAWHEVAVEFPGTIENIAASKVVTAEAGAVFGLRCSRHDAQQQEEGYTGQLAPDAAEEHDGAEHDGVLDEGAQTEPAEPAEPLCSAGGEGGVTVLLRRVRGYRLRWEVKGDAFTLFMGRAAS